MTSIENLYQLFLKHPSICTDSRKLKPGDLFFALKGENFNGNRFAGQALREGAAYAVIDETPETGQENFILVNDVLKTLQTLAGHHRDQFSIPFIGITGSNGKTTTKELIHAVLSTTYRTYTTEGNLNNHIGIPLTILKIKADAEMAVVEMGANHLREIAGYCEYAKPTHGIITNCGKAHLEGFGSVENVRKGKGELYDWLRTHGGTAFVMWDYNDLREMSKGIAEIVSYGTFDAAVTGIVDGEGPLLRVKLTRGVHNQLIQTQLAGKYNLPNVLAAVTVGTHFNVDPAKIKTSLEAYRPSNSRSQILPWGSNTVVLDAYNANPSSMRVAIENFASISSSEKVLVLGAMAELGDSSILEHQELLRQIAGYPWKEVVLVGGDFLRIKNKYRNFQTAAEAGEWLKSRHFENSFFLVKGSRSIGMERIIDS
ncbi:MAG: UDP-N-acetylmuramoyl-tripeptide--D-alanyl-D-alanine ligase [Bacteroidota bacterium]|nr:UDP-N-acetylmuramoyl-tripeptide--D-alanyl-D-alanine ligase [Bacteroidota bacterium]MDP4211319.1 UDP-N-acetylmuramoyl-tripeptide--D-alanyl-D-alanine ligase [Bacteroidota bacterium]MDP4249992.1 UDP-N-acetylmuramoyl-tripeptide--D-alanyl-D-alanine ligase [Bacteroidota bacterium]